MKLENVLVDTEGHIKIIDFGTSKEQMTYGSTTRSFCGSALYMAPEILENKDYSRAIDWWCIGISVFAMICGFFPFDDENSRTLFNKIRNDAIPFPSCISSSARLLITGLLAKSPYERLGGGPNDALDVQAHPFFSSIDWTDVDNKNIAATFKPPIESDTDTSNFEAWFTDMSFELTPPSTIEYMGEMPKFPLVRSCTIT